MKLKSIILVFLLVTLSLSSLSCGASSEFEKELPVLESFTEKYQGATVTVLDRYDLENRDAIYYLRYTASEGEERELLAVYRAASDSADLIDLAELPEDLKTKWDELKNARPDRSFSETEIEKILSAI